MGLAWDRLHSSDEDELDLDLLTAYAEGTLSTTERAECEDLMARNPEALHLVAAIWKTGVGDPHSQSIPAIAAHRPAERTRTPRGMWLAVAASLLVAVTAGVWSVRSGRQTADLQTSLLAMQDQLTDAQLQLVVEHKGRYLTLAGAGGARNYWNGTVTPTMLDLPQSRGIVAAVPPEAVAEDRQAQQALRQITQSDRNQSRVLLEQIAIDLAAGRLKQADAIIKQVAELIGETPDVLNARAMRSLAERNPRAFKQAEHQLRRLTSQYPDYLPGWYNLALILEEQADHNAESRRAWQEYLKRETRKGFRRIAQSHLSALPTE